MFGSSDIETGALTLSMSKEDLMSFVEALRKGAATSEPLSPGTHRPMLRPITHLSLQPEETGSLLIAIDGENAKVSGDQNSFELLADELVVFERENDLNEPGMHAHFDPSERQSNGLEIANDSVELVVTGPVPDE